MENIILELEKKGYNIMSIVNGTSNEKVLNAFYKNRGSDIIISEWTNDDINNFAEKIYNIITKYDKAG